MAVLGTRRAGDRGEGRIGLIIAIVIVALIIHVCVKLIPVRIARSEFADYAASELQMYAGHQINQDVLMTKLGGKAADLKLPINDGDIQFEDRSSEYAITLHYTVHLKMIWGDWPQKMDVEQTAPKIG